MAIKSPKIVESVNSLTINCPADQVPNNEYAMCDIKIKGGTDLKVSINYGDGTVTQEFYPIGISYFYFNTNLF